MKTLVTGGAGFIGSNLVRRLLADGNEVRVIDNLATGRSSNLDAVRSDIEFIEADIRDSYATARAVSGTEVVFHQAALPSVPRSVNDPLTSNAVNVEGTLNVLLAARDAGTRRVVTASSSSIYGSNPELPKREEMSALPMSPYAVSKLAAESYCRSFTNVYGLETVALRYFNVFGPLQDPTSQYAAVIPNFVTAALTGNRPIVHGDGEQSRDFTFIDNVVSANILAGKAPAASGLAFNIAYGETVSLNDVLGMISTQTGEPIDPIHEDARVGDVRASLADISLARKLLDYDPKVSFADGLALTIEHFRSLLGGVTQPS